MRINTDFRKTISRSLNYFLVVTSTLLLSAHTLLKAQDTKKIEELTRKLEEINKQMEACGSDLGCVQSKISEIEQISKEIQSLQKDIQKDPGKFIEDVTSNLPKENQFPAPFEIITKTWLKHTMAVSAIMRLDCNVINSTREGVLDQINSIYNKGKGLTGPNWPLPLNHCEETNIKLSEHGILNEPDNHYLDYKLEFIDNAVWTVDFILLIGDAQIGYKDKQTYTLGVASPHKRISKVLNFSGWIKDHSKNPPVELPLNRYEILKQEIIDIGVQVPSYQGYTLIVPENMIEDPNDKYKIGKATSYRMLLPYQIVRFYPASKPELYIENTKLIGNISNATDAKFSPQKIQSYFQKGKFIKNYSADGITQVLEIGFPGMGCDDQVSSDKGAIILSGDCIDHGGYVIASDANLTVNGKTVARIGDKVICYKHGETEIIAVEKNNVTAGKKQIARIGDKTKCGATLLGGSRNTFAGDK
ncbi:MAG: PAAR domain-containing protein [Ignavibacteriaceae bacterium]